MNKSHDRVVDRHSKVQSNLRTTCLILTVVFAAVSARAQDPAPTVESLAADLAALKARVAKLDGPIQAADFAGTYAFRGFQVELGGGSPARVSSYVFAGTVVLAADGTVNFSAPPEVGNTLAFTAPPLVSPFKGNGGGTFTSAWSYADGALTITGLPPLAIAAGGNILVAASANNADGTNVIIILTRMPPPPPATDTAKSALSR